MNKSRLKYFGLFIIVLIIEIIIALFVHDKFIRPYIGDVLVVVCIYFFMKSILLDKVKYLSLYIFIFAAGVEIAQGLHLFDFVTDKSRFLKILLGATFDIKDIICYFCGFILLVIGEKLSKK